ncbi:MAG TPA: FixH family protein [Burkholderiales bacterium]|nr:FixH family protein [Burkholderiales bacterium]
MRWSVLFLLLVCAQALAQRLNGNLDCRYTGTDFIYDCRIALQRGGQPLSGAQITVGADMPSMPMAHNIKPVKATPTGTPGEYRARLDLEMTGEWAVKLRIAGPVRDQLVLHYIFTESGTAPRK